MLDFLSTFNLVVFYLLAVILRALILWHKYFQLDCHHMPIYFLWAQSSFGKIEGLKSIKMLIRIKSSSICQDLSHWKAVWAQIAIFFWFRRGASDSRRADSAFVCSKDLMPGTWHSVLYIILWGMLIHWCLSNRDGEWLWSIICEEELNLLEEKRMWGSSIWL